MRPTTGLRKSPGEQRVVNALDALCWLTNKDKRIKAVEGLRRQSTPNANRSAIGRLGDDVFEMAEADRIV